MKQPPKMLTGKDCLYLSDIMEATLTFAKKANFFASVVENEKIRKMFLRLESDLSGEYGKLLSIMGGQ